ncbi:MAG: two-component system response regulator [Deltaproteobacteria bacterium RIFOXYD12_FULL_57_12]|nr:MAG: two-component system response regulator [Deltaproteobacteria bacterium RIFOXYD12_FULL_57_12]
MAIIKVLVVDDETDFLEMTVKRLLKRNIFCEGVSSGREAVEKVRDGSFDVVLLDVKMPGMNGLETLQEIKQHKPLVEVVMLTGHASVESGIDGMKLGAFDYLMKPMELEPLLEILLDAAERKAIQEAKITKAELTRNLRGQRPGP